MMKFLLINPYLNEGLLFYGFMKKVGSTLPPLGLLYIAAFLEENGIEVKIIDNQVENYSLKRLVQEIDNFQPELIGISSITTQLLYTLIIAKTIKSNFKDIKIVVGGPHATALPEELLNHCPDIDFLILGEAEIPLLKLINNLKNPQELKKVPGIMYKSKSGGFVSNPPHNHKDINELPFPARHLLPMEKYRPSPINYRNLPSRSLITSRGCPYNCSYCFKLTPNVRYNNANKIINEISILREDYNAKELIFWDDSFFFNKKRIENLFQLMNLQNIDIPWMAMARIDQINKKWLLKAKKNGCWRLGFGIESGDKRVLNKMNKPLSFLKTFDILKFCRKIGIETRIFFIIGSPYDTKQSIEKTIQLAKRLNPDNAQFTYYVPFPNTTDYNYIIQRKESFDPQYYFKDVYPDYHNLDKLIYTPPGLTESQLKKYHALAYFNFYFRIKYILQNIKKTRKFSEFYRNLSISFSLINQMILKLIP